MITKPMRVLQVLGWLDLGGAETFIMEIYRKTNRDEIQFDFVKHTFKKCFFEDEITELGGKIYTCPRYELINHFAYCNWWNNFFIKHPEYNVIHGHVRSTAAIYLKIAKKHGLTTIAHSHSTSNGKGVASIVKYLIQLPIRHTADYLFSCSDKAGKWLFGEKAMRQAKYHLIPNCINLERFTFDLNQRKNMRMELGICDDEFVIGHVGRFAVAKNHRFLVELFSEYLKRNPQSRLLMIGDGELYESIKKQCEKNGIAQKVIMTGSCANTEKYYQAMDIFVAPSLWEGFLIVAIEAQANGLPCLLTNTITRDVGLTDLVTYLPLNDEMAWLNAFDTTKDKGSRCEISVVNRQKLSSFDSKRIAEKLESFYQEQCEK